MNAHVFIEMRDAHAYLDQVQTQCARLLDRSRHDVIGLAADLVTEQGRVPLENRLPVCFAQFMVCAWALNDAMEAGDLSACGDWIGWALSESIEPGHEVTIQVARLDEFWSSRSVSSSPCFAPTLVLYLSAFYYYARRRAAMRDVGIAFWGVSMKLLGTLMAQPAHCIHPHEAFFGSNMLAWAALEASSEAQRLTPQVEAWIDDRALPANVRSVYCLTLATNAGRFSVRPQVDWARRTLEEFEVHVIGEQRVQMLAAVFDASSEGDAEGIMAAMEEYQAVLHQNLSPLAFVIETGFKADVIQPFVVRCLDAGLPDTALLGIARWYQAPTGNDAIDPRSVLVLSPFSEYGYLAACHRSSKVVERDSQLLLERLTQETNEFIGAAYTVTRADNSALWTPERPGVPDVAGGANWFATLREVYCPVEPPEWKMIRSQLTLLPVAHAFQAVQLATWGVTWPIAASLSTPRPDHRPRMVALWSGGGSLTEEMELEMVRAALEAAGATVETFGPDGSTPEHFLAVYQDPKYDIIWVASHGEFDHWSPRRVELQVAASGTTVALSELIDKTPPRASRRLLVLNICDGARFEEIGFVPRVGLAAGLAAPQQATVSHLWPVLGFPSAAFGAYLAHHLTTCTSFFDAYVRSLGSMRKSSPAIAEELQALYGRNYDLLDRLRSREDDFSPLQFSGSAAFFQ